MNIVSLPRNKSCEQAPSARMPRRMAALSSLPVFLSLEGRRVIVAGGSDAAAWKAELLAACGAAVHVFAPEPGPVLTGLLSGGDHAPGAILHHAAAWTDESLQGAAVAVADAESEEEARAFLAAGRHAGVPVNVIDRPAFCQFSFGSIVNRSPVVIGISTGGAAPILAQAVRRRIESLIPPTLAVWAGLARRLRARVGLRLASALQRRLFWETFSDRAFRDQPGDDALDRLLGDIEAMAGMPVPSQGKVTLIGTGPGEADLLTLRALRALQAADVILFDDSVSGEILELARREAGRMRVREGENMSERIAELARSGRQVVRLRSGVPATDRPVDVEIACLEIEGIAVTIVPAVAPEAARPVGRGASSSVSAARRSVPPRLGLVAGHGR